MDSVINLFLKAWRQEDYVPGDELPDWVELSKEDFIEILHRFASILTATNSKPAMDALSIQAAQQGAGDDLTP
jgi:hypothetical protein